MTKAASATADYASDEIVFIPLKQIFPDPDQPRVHADDELRGSIEAQGIIQAITVRPHPALGESWMIVDGERRWRSAPAGTEIPCRIRLDLEDDAARLITQITANTGKPLSPIEQARAFKKILDADEKLTQVELAKRLGVPRSTIGDRIRLLEIHPAWVELIETGKLQLSHAPAMHRFREVPEKYQLQAVERLLSKGTGYGLGHDIGKGEAIRIDLFESRIRDCFRPFMRAVSDVPGYKGPTVEFKDWDSRRKYAVDPDQWKPIRNAQIKRAREKRAKGGDDSSSGQSAREHKSAAQVDVERLEKQGVPVKPTKQYRPKPEKGETEIFSMRGFEDNLDVKTLLASIDPASLTIRRSTDRWNPQAIVVTTDTNAVTLARAAYIANLKAAAAEHCSKLLRQLTESVLRSHAVAGPGARWLTNGFGAREDGGMFVLAMALRLRVVMATDKHGEMTYTIVENDDAEKLLSALAAVSALGLKLPEAYRVRNDANSNRHTLRFKLPEVKSKKQEKRDARGRGEQVGDPTRAPAPRARQFEEELVGA